VYARGESAVFAPLSVDPVYATPISRMSALVHEIEVRIDERSGLARSLRPRTQEFLTGTLRYGNEKVIVGRDGWLFYRGDIDHLLSRDNSQAFSGDPLAEIVAFRDALAQRGVALVLVPVPLQPTIHPEHLVAGARAPIRRLGERAFLALLDERGVEVVDLAEQLANAAATGPAYLATDSHWLPETVEIAAREIALRLRDVVDLPPGDPSSRTEEVVRRGGIGGSAYLLGLPNGSPLFAPERMDVRRVQSRPSQTTPDRAPVLLLGDSFSGIYSVADPRWGSDAGLSERLAFRLGLPVDRIVVNGGGASATRERLAAELAADSKRLRGVRVVVWEFAARELSQGEWRPIALPPEG